MSRCSVLLVLAAGCTTYVEPESAELDAARTTLVEGSPEALGMLAFVNDPSTTVSVLDDAVGLDSRAAKGIVAHRDGVDGETGTRDDDRFDTVAELDAVYYVGDSALSAILAYATDHGFVATDPGDVLGTWDGVTFTVAEAEAVLDVVNTATTEELDVDAALDRRAVDSIVGARPIATVQQLAALPYVGTSALTKLQSYAVPAADAWTTAELEAALTPAIAGVTFPSESDFPLELVVLPGAYPVDASTIQAAVAPIYVQRPDETPLADREVQEETVDQALGFLVTPADWWTEDEVNRAAQWQPILDAVQHLDHPMVYRLGDDHGYGLTGSIDVYVVGGSAEGDLVGFHTISVET